MLRPMSPVPILFVLFALLLVPTSSRAADLAKDPPASEPIVLAATTDAGASASREDVVVTEEVAPAHETDHASLEAPTTDTEDVSTDEAAGVCKEYGQVCRKSRECCAPMRCAFDGYVYYCRY